MLGCRWRLWKFGVQDYGDIHRFGLDVLFAHRGNWSPRLLGDDDLDKPDRKGLNHGEDVEDSVGFVFSGNEGTVPPKP